LDLSTKLLGMWISNVEERGSKKEGCRIEGLVRKAGYVFD